MNFLWDDFCWCQVNPIIVGLVVCIITTLIGAVVSTYFVFGRRNPQPLGSRYPGWALVTGASRGLGRVAALSLASEKFQGIVLHATENSREELQSLANEIKDRTNGQVKTQIVLCNLSESEQVSKMIDQIQNLEISLLVNNAGFGANGQFDKIPLETQLRMISTNCSALVHLTHYVVSQHRKRNSSKSNSKCTAIANIGSLAAAPCGLPWQSTYAATKAFVSSFSHGIAYSLRNEGVRVVLVEPGTIPDTSFQSRSEQPPHPGSNSTESVVKAMLYKLRYPSTYHHIIPSLHDTITYYGSKFLPDKLVLRLGAKRGLKYSPNDKK